MTIHRHRRGAGWLRGTARALGLAQSTLWSFLVVAGGIASLVDGDEEFTWESGALLALVLAAVAGVAVSFRNELMGGRIVIVAGAGLCVFALISAGHNHLLAMMVSGVPFLVTGGLFWLLAARPVVRQ